jgi:hypothetical protein
MKQELITVADTEKPLNPCQLKKIWGSAKVSCSFDCAFDHDCPIYYCDEHEQPVISGHKRQ